MRILKLLNKKHLSIVIIFLTSILSLNAEDQPVDIWNIEKKIVVKESEIDSAINLEKEPTTISSENSIYKMQSEKEGELSSKIFKLPKELKIIGLYDPDDYGLDINMWSNSYVSKEDAQKLMLKHVGKDAFEILNISLLTNAYYPNQNITEEESF